MNTCVSQNQKHFSIYTHLRDDFKSFLHNKFVVTSDIVVD